MWKEQSVDFISGECWESKSVFKSRPTLSRRYAALNGRHHIRMLKPLHTDHNGETPFLPWKIRGRAALEGVSWVKPPEAKRFGISLTGIRVRKEEISIDPEKLKSNVFYLFSVQNEKYVARKTKKGIIEIYEVAE